MHRTIGVFAISAALAFACFCPVGAETFSVKPGESIHAAIEAARLAPGKPHCIVLASGRHMLSAPLTLDERDNGLAIRGSGAKTVIYGGTPVKGWEKEPGTKFWSAPIPGARDGKRDFRVLMVNGASRPRAKLPGGTNRFELVAGWDYSPSSGVMGVWPREPSYADCVTLRCRREDLPQSLDIRNAEVMHYHIWRDSYARIASNDAERAILWMAHPGSMPIGAARFREYELYNLREGMLEPGQWYLDRTKERVVYWPMPGEDCAKLDVVAPVCETAIKVSPIRPGALVEGVTLCDFSLACVSAAPENAVTCGDAGANASPAIFFSKTRLCKAEGLDISDVGGVGVRFGSGVSNRLARCFIHETGAAGVYLIGQRASEVASNRVWRTGRLYASSAGMRLSGSDLHVFANTVLETPYCGLSVGGRAFLIEDNEVGYSMQGLADGGGIYGCLTAGSVVRRNAVHDIPSKKKGSRGIYLDENAADVLVEDNVVWNVPDPLQYHIAHRIVTRRNVFQSSDRLRLEFGNSANCTFTENIVVSGSPLYVGFGEAVTNWTGNRMFAPEAAGAPCMFLGNVPPLISRQPRRPTVRMPLRNAEVVADGVVGAGEWPDRRMTFFLDERGRRLGGGTSAIRAFRTAHTLNFAFRANVAGITGGATCSTGTVWGVDDAVEFSFEGNRWIRLFACGKATASSPDMLAGARWYAGPVPGSNRRGRYPFVAELSLQCKALGVEPVAGRVLNFNVKAHLAPISQTRHWESSAPYPDGTIPSDPPGLLLFE